MQRIVQKIKEGYKNKIKYTKDNLKDERKARIEKS